MLKNTLTDEQLCSLIFFLYLLASTYIKIFIHLSHLKLESNLLTLLISLEVPQLPHKKMKIPFLLNMSKSGRLTSTFFPIIGSDEDAEEEVEEPPVRALRSSTSSSEPIASSSSSPSSTMVKVSVACNAT